VKYLLDTCVLSDGARPAQFPQLAKWLGAQATEDLAVGALTVGELRDGIQRLPSGRKRERLKQWLDSELLPTFADRVLPIDGPVADAWALLRGSGEEMGRELPIVDGLLLATAQVHGLTFVTRNLADVENRGIAVLSPY
jgi:predicted nucleic acid-binding protein